MQIFNVLLILALLLFSQFFIPAYEKNSYFIFCYVNYGADSWITFYAP